MFSIDFSQWVKLLDLWVLVLVDFGKSTYSRATTSACSPIYRGVAPTGTNQM